MEYGVAQTIYFCSVSPAPALLLIMLVALGLTGCGSGSPGSDQTHAGSDWSFNTASLSLDYCDCAASGSGFYVLGTQTNNANEIGALKLCLLDASGSLVWQKALRHSGGLQYSSICRLAPAPDGAVYVVWSETPNRDSVQPELRAAQIRADGTVGWARSLSDSTSQLLRSYLWVGASADGSRLGIAFEWVDLGAAGSAPQRLSLVSLDSSGSELSRRLLSSSATPDNAPRQLNLCTLNDGRLLVLLDGNEQNGRGRISTELLGPGIDLEAANWVLDPQLPPEAGPAADPATVFYTLYGLAQDPLSGQLAACGQAYFYLDTEVSGAPDLSWPVYFLFDSNGELQSARRLAKSSGGNLFGLGWNAGTLELGGSLLPEGMETGPFEPWLFSLPPGPGSQASNQSLPAAAGIAHLTSPAALGSGLLLHLETLHTGGALPGAVGAEDWQPRQTQWQVVDFSRESSSDYTVQAETAESSEISVLFNEPLPQTRLELSNTYLLGHGLP